MQTITTVVHKGACLRSGTWGDFGYEGPRYWLTYKPNTVLYS